MKTTFYFILLFFICCSNTFANEQWLGTFKGDETMEVTNCKASQYNGTVKRKWTVTHTELDGNKYKGAGKIPNEPGFTVEAEINGNTAISKAKGKDNWGNAWSTTSDVTLDGDALTVTYSGNSPATGCKFSGEITATRH